MVKRLKLSEKTLRDAEPAHYTTPSVFGRVRVTLCHGRMASRGSVLRRLRMWSKPVRYAQKLVTPDQAAA